jgi:hypothetical protein
MYPQNSMDVEVPRCRDLRAFAECGKRKDKSIVQPSTKTMPFRDLYSLAGTVYDDFRGLPQVDFQRVGRKIASACLPNGRIDHDVIQKKLALRRYHIIQRKNRSYISVSAPGASRVRIRRQLPVSRKLLESSNQHPGNAFEPRRDQLLLRLGEWVGHK